MRPNEPIHQPEDDEREQAQIVQEVSLQTIYDACRSLLEPSASPLNDYLTHRVEALALALQGCVNCARSFGELHISDCGAKGRVYAYDLDSDLRQPKPPEPETTF